MVESKRVSSTEIVALAAGKGTRAESVLSGIPKVLREVDQKPLLEYIIASSEALGICPIVVIGFLGDKIQERFGERARWVTQNLEEAQGTAAAVKAALQEIDDSATDVLIIPGDHGYIYSEANYAELETIHRESQDDITIVAFNVSNPDGYGRIILDEENNVAAIVEQTHLTEDQKGIDLINSGTMMVRNDMLSDLINAIQTNPETGESYLTDIVAVARERGLKIGVYVPNDIEFMDGINTLAQLAMVQKKSFG